VAHARAGRPAMKFLAPKVGGLPAADIAERLFLDETDGVALVDAQGIVLHENAQLRSMLGAIHRQCVWSGLPAEAAATLAAELRAGRAATVQATLGSAGGAGQAPRVLRLAVLPMPRGGALLRVTDRTHERSLEDQLGQAQRLQAVGELAGGIAHDFNNLLTAILGAAEDVKARSRNAADSEDLDQICASAERGAALVRQLLAFSRQQTLQPRVVALNDAIRSTAQLLRRLLGAGVTLTLELEEPSRRVRIDPTQLDQVLVNLSVNASHAMPQGGVLTISSGPKLVLKPETFGGETLPPGRYASLSVRDTGNGIPADLLPRIFEPFFTTRKEKGGTGLGLSTVHGIVRQSGGYMAVESEAGVGTIFRILLPRHEETELFQAEPATPGPPPEAVVSGGTATTVLLVDDEAPVRRLAERALTREGWQVVAAASAEEALEAVESQDMAERALAFVVSDVVMPGMDGPALVRQLREQRPGLPAILMSGYADSGLRTALQAADIRFLAKPFGMAELVRAAQELAQSGQVSANVAFLPRSSSGKNEQKKNK